MAHSLNLSKLFEEAEPIFKTIRKKLNNLTLEKKSPKMRRASSGRNKDVSPTSVVYNPDSFGMGGNAGKSSYTVNVGQVDNLYISAKRNFIHSKTFSRRRPSIDYMDALKTRQLRSLMRL